MNDSEVTDDVKRRFREALAKKQAHGGTDISEHAARGKVSGRNGPKAGQQMFRRKSG